MMVLLDESKTDLKIAFKVYLEYKKEYQAKKATLMAQYQSRFDSASSDKERISLETKLKSALTSLDREKEVDHISQSYMGRIGKVIAPFFAPIGIDWRGGVALLTGFVAKEIVVSTLGVLYSAGGASEETALQLALRNSEMTPLAALAMMVFVLLYLPCMATVMAIKKETGSIKWMIFSIGYSTSMAWMAAFLVYQVGRFFGLG